jgi:DNA-binding transcriptional MerR regulator
MRLTITDMVKETGLCPDTIRKYADSGKIPSIRDANSWRIFNEKSLEVAKGLAGISEKLR